MQLTARDVAKLLNVSEKTIYRWVQQGEMPAYRFQDQYRFNRSELFEWATLRRINVSPEILTEPESSAQLLPGLAEAVQMGGIHYRVEGASKEAVLERVASLLPLPEDTDRDFFFRVLLAREVMAATAVGGGVALPHPRVPVGAFAARAFVTLVFLEDPVDFGAFDGESIYALFVVISPTARGHLHLLSRLTFALRDQGLRDVLAQRSLRETILGELRRVEAGFHVPKVAEQRMIATAQTPAAAPGGPFERRRGSGSCS